MDAPVLSVIIANYNGRQLLADCLESVYANAPSCAFEVIVVDDASWDGSAEMVAERFPQVRLLRNARNVHYGKSNNRAMTVAQGRYVYLLNNDTLVLPGALDAMRIFLDDHPRVGAVGSKLLNGDGSVQWSVKCLPSVGSGLFGARSILTKMFPNNPVSRKHLLHLGSDLSTPFEAGYVSSASVMMRREVVERVGGLDERLSYHVDADYCRRIWDAGYQVYYLPAATVIHFDHKGGTMVTRRRRFKSIIEFHRGSYIYFRKHHPRIKRFWHPMHFVAIAGLGARFGLSLSLFALKECRGVLDTRLARHAPQRDQAARSVVR